MLNRYIRSALFLLALLTLLLSPPPASGAANLTVTGNLMLWLKADSLKLADGAAVGSWPDSSGNNRNAAPAVASGAPRFIVEGVNHLPSVRFDGVDDFLAVPYFNPTEGLTCFVVFRSTSAKMKAGHPGNAPANILGYNSNNILGGFGLANGSVQLNILQHDVWRQTTGHIPVNDGRPQIISFSHSNTGRDLDRVYQGTELVASGSYAFTTPLPLGLNCIGGGYDPTATVVTAGDCFGGDISEILVYAGVLSGPDRSAVDAYLADKYAVATPPHHTEPAAKAATPEVPITYQLPRSGKVSMAIYDSRGRQLRTLLAGVAQKAGEHRTSWDGLDREGLPMPVGTYTWKVLMNDGLEAQLVTLLGANAPPPVWSSWIGNHRGPTVAVVNTKGEVYVGTSVTEGPPALMKLRSDDGPILWRLPQQSIGTIALAEMGDACISLSPDDYLYRYEAATGRMIGAKLDVLWRGDTREDLFNSDHSMSLTAVGSLAVISYRNHDALRWIDPITGRIDRAAAVRRPSAVALGNGGTIYVISDTNKVVAVSTGGAVVTVIGDGVLSAPGALAYDKINHQLLVADGGADQRVRRFGADGSPIKTYGRKGGRLAGAYVEGDFFNVGHLDCDGASGFYAVEPNGIRRIVHVRADGSVAKQWLGGTPFNTVASADPSTPREVWYDASNDTIVKTDLDPDTGAWRVLETYTMPAPTFGDGLFPELTKFPLWRARRFAGDPNTYLIHESPAAIMRVDAAARRLVPVALAWYKHTSNAASATLLAAMASKGQTFTDKDNDAFTWSDTNGNGKMDPEEFRFYKEAAGMSLLYTAFDDHMNVYAGYRESPFYDYDGHHYLHFDYEGSVYVKLPNLANRPGTPIWDWRYLERSKAKVPAQMREGFTGYATRSIRCDSEGGVILYMMGSSGDRHNTWWPTASMTSAHLLRALPDGTTCWTVSKHLSPGMPPATMNGYPTYLTGATHGCVVATDHNANYGATVWTDDGLYAGGFLDRHTDGLPDWCYEVSGHDFGYEAWLPGDDWSSGGSLTDQPDGSVMWFPPGGGRVGVYRIRGWKNWFRDSGNIKLTASPTAAPPDTDLTSGLTGTYYRGAAFAGTPVYTATDTCPWFSSTPVSFGDPTKWPDGRVVNWSDGPCPGIGAKQPFSVRWTGRLVAPLGEEFWLCVYNQFQVIEYAPLQIWKDGAGFARVWLDGVLVIDHSPGKPATELAQAGPIRLQAGRSYDVKIEYAYPGASVAAGGSGADFSLCWASNTLELERIPPAYLHTEPTRLLPAVHLMALDPHAAEAHQKPGLVRFNIDTPLHQNLTVRYRLEGSADADDYLPLSGEVVIPAGELSADVIVTPVDDAVSEGDETVRFVLKPDATYRGDGTVGTATVVITDDDNRVTSGLVAYYPLDEAPATQHVPPDDPEDIVVHDRVGGHDGAFMTSWSGFPAPLPRWLPTAGKLGGALDFYDEPSRVSLPGSLVKNSDFTLALWVRTREADTQFITSPTAQRPLFALVSGRLSVSLGATTLAPAGPRLSDGVWHHVALLWDRTKHQMAMAVDGGAPVGSESGPAAAQLNDLILGTNIHTWSKSFIGELDDVRIYNRCLSPGEITTLAHMPLPHPVPNP